MCLVAPATLAVATDCNRRPSFFLMQCHVAVCGRRLLRHWQVLVLLVHCPPSLCLMHSQALVSAVECQNGMLISYIGQQQSYAKHMRELCSTRRVAGLLQALVSQHKVTHLLPGDTIFKALQAHLAGRRTHGCLDSVTLIDDENITPAASVVLTAEPPSMTPQAGAAGNPHAASYQDNQDPLLATIAAKYCSHTAIQQPKTS